MKIVDINIFNRTENKTSPNMFEFEGEDIAIPILRFSGIASGLKIHKYSDDLTLKFSRLTTKEPRVL